MSETMSPVDYSPVAIATASSPTASSLDGQRGSPIKLSIECRGGRNDVVFGGAIFARAEGHTVSYSVDDGRTWAPVATMQPSTTGVALKGDAVPFLQALPREGTLVFRFAGYSGPAVESRYALPALKSVLDRLSKACRWPGR
ncbi:MAG TPA: hypothetical protein VKY24_01940 [Reyranella sp.]|nr:hypothetical protein [Reyranella sp.]